MFVQTNDELLPHALASFPKGSDLNRKIATKGSVILGEVDGTSNHARVL